MVAIPFGVKLAQQTQVFRPKAAGAPPISFTSSQNFPNTVDCSTNPCTTKSSTVDMQITSPIGGPPGVTQ